MFAERQSKKTFGVYYIFVFSKKRHSFQKNPTLNSLEQLSEIVGMGVDFVVLSSTDCMPFLASQERFNKVEVQPDGYGLY